MTSFLDKNGLEYYNGKINTKLANKQDTLVSGTNIKTINSNSIVGSGDLDVTNTAVLTYGISTWSDFTDAYNKGKMVFCLVPQSSGYRYATLNYAELGSRGKAEFLYVRKTNHSSGQQSDQMYTYTLSPNSTWATVQTNIGSNVTTATDSGLTKSYSGGALTLDVNKETTITSSSTDAKIPTAKAVYDIANTKQDTLISGTNIKTINNTSILGSGNITISGGGGGETTVYVQTTGSPYGTTSETAIDFDNLVKGNKYIYNNSSLSNDFYYKYTNHAGTVTTGFLTNETSDNRHIMGSATGKYARIEIEMYESVSDAYTESTTLGEALPFAKVTLYPISTVKNKVNDDSTTSSIVEYIFSAYTNGTIDIFSYRKSLCYTDSQWIGKVVNDIQTDVTTAQSNITSLQTGKQDTLVSGTSIKTINNESLLGSGNITISGGGGAVVETYIQSTDPYGGSSAMAIDFDSMVKGGKYIYHNTDFSTSLFYKYTNKSDVVTTTFINPETTDNRHIMGATTGKYKRIEVEMYETVYDALHTDNSLPFAKVTLYPTAYSTNKTNDDNTCSTATEYIFYTYGKYGMLNCQKTMTYVDAQWIGKVINDLQTQITNITT